MSAAIWSASIDDIRAFPARSFLQFFKNHGLISLNDRPEWRTVAGGSVVYVDRLTAPFRHRVLAGIGARRVARTESAVIVQDTHGISARYDAVVMACHADQALAIIEAPTPAEGDILSAFSYQGNDACLHSDPRLMPRRRALWSGWNYLASSARPGNSKVSITYWMNHLQQLDCDEPAFVSLNPLHQPRPEHVIARMRYDHPVFDHQALQAQRRLAEIQGRDRLWFAGAHWGFGFHEDGLVSGLRVAASLGVAPPWWPNVEPLLTPRPARSSDLAQAVGGAD
jgi:hypothetical protein